MLPAENQKQKSEEKNERQYDGETCLLVVIAAGHEHVIPP